jgi:hypothetical protein
MSEMITITCAHCGEKANFSNRNVNMPNSLAPAEQLPLTITRVGVMKPLLSFHCPNVKCNEQYPVPYNDVTG